MQAVLQTALRKRGFIMAAMETIQIRLDPMMKRDLERLCTKKGVTVSETVRELISADLYRQKTPAEELAEIFDEIDERVEASGLPTPSIDEIVAFCERFREERNRGVAM